MSGYWSGHTLSSSSHVIENDIDVDPDPNFVAPADHIPELILIATPSLQHIAYRLITFVPWSTDLLVVEWPVDDRIFVRW